MAAIKNTSNNSHVDETNVATAGIYDVVNSQWVKYDFWVCPFTLWANIAHRFAVTYFHAV